MTRNTFGATTADFLMTTGPGGLMRVSAGSLTMWDSETGGTQLTDLVLNGAPVSVIPVDSSGRVPKFQGPDDIVELWADGGGGSRARLVTVFTDVASATDAGMAALVPTSSGSATSAALAAAFVSFKTLAKNPDELITGAITRNSNGVVTSAAVVWPDGKPGTFTTDTIGTNNTIDGYHITYGSPVTKTYTQPTITRDSSGAATNVPAIVVS